MIEIIDNKDKINDNELTWKNGKINVIAINENNEVILIKNHSTYYFLSEYIEGDLINSLKRCLKNNINFELDCNYEPSLLQKEYLSDYPLIGDKTLNYNYYYIVYIKSFPIDVSNNSNKYSINFVPLKYLVKELENNKFDNPRNRLITENMIKIVELLFK